MPATFSRTAAPAADARVDIRAEVARGRACVLVFYAVDAALLGVLGAAGTVPAASGLWFALAGGAASELAFWRFRRRGSRPADLEPLCLALTVATLALMLAMLGLAPEVGGLMLMSMMAVLALGAVQMKTRHLVALCGLLAVAAVAVLATTHGSAGVPTATTVERTVTTVWLAWLMAKASAHNLTGTRLRQQVGRANAELAEALRMLGELAATDDLTRLPNRRTILEDVERAVAARQRRGAPVGIVLLDIDGFKLVNDRLGHEIGDRVLHDFARVLAEGLRPSDRVGRYGGEEFLLVLRDFDHAGAATDIVERLRSRIAAHDWSGIEPGLKVTASAGVTLLLVGEAGAAAIRRADAALYEAKRRGRDRVVTDAEPLAA